MTSLVQINTRRGHRLSVAVISGVCGKILSLIPPLMALGPMLSYVGPETFGLWLTATSVSAVATLFDFGIGSAALTRLSAALGRDDIRSARKLLGDAYILLSLISSALLLVLLVVTLCVRHLSPFAVSTDQAVITLIVLLTVTLNLPASLILRHLQARQKFIQLNLAQSSAPFIAFAMCIFAIKMGFSPHKVIAYYSLSGPVTLLVWSLVYFAIHSGERPLFCRDTNGGRRHLVRASGAFFALSLFSLVGMNLDQSIIIIVSGPVAVATFGVPAKLGGVLMLLVGTLFQPLWSLFGDALARRDGHWLKRITNLMSWGGASIILSLGVLITAFSTQIMQMWMRKQFLDQTLVLMGCTVAATIIASTAPYNMMLNAASMARAQLWPWAMFVGLSVSAKVFFIPKYGAWVAPWITAAVYAVVIAAPMRVVADRLIKATDRSG